MSLNSLTPLKSKKDFLYKIKLALISSDINSESAE